MKTNTAQQTTTPRALPPTGLWKMPLQLASPVLNIQTHTSQLFFMLSVILVGSGSSRVCCPCSAWVPMSQVPAAMLRQGLLYPPQQTPSLAPEEQTP